VRYLHGYEAAVLFSEGRRAPRLFTETHCTLIFPFHLTTHRIIIIIIIIALNTSSLEASFMHRSVLFFLNAHVTNVQA